MAKLESLPKKPSETIAFLIDDNLRHENDAPTIGLLLCQNKDQLLAEYSLRGIQKPIGVSEYELTQALPGELASSLPTIEQIEAELSTELKKETKESIGEK